MSTSALCSLPSPFRPCTIPPERRAERPEITELVVPSLPAFSVLNSTACVESQGALRSNYFFMTKTSRERTLIEKRQTSDPTHLVFAHNLGRLLVDLDSKTFSCCFNDLLVVTGLADIKAVDIEYAEDQMARLYNKNSSWTSFPSVLGFPGVACLACLKSEC